jgi:Ca-activated chloride channel family protein
VPLSFERPLRPGTFRLVLKLEENRSGRAMRLERDIEVPELPEGPAAGAALGPPPALAPFRLLAPAADLLSGVVRVEAEVGDERVRSVSFSLDGKPLLTRNRPPWTVELRVGELPRSVRVRAVAHDAQGASLAADELLLNGAPHRFTVRLVEPREGAVTAPVRVRVEVRPPEERTVDRLELFLDDTPLATLYQEPWEVLVPRLPEPAPLYLRVVAYLADGATAEDAVLLAGGEGQRGTVEVDLVEVYTAVVDDSGRPMQGLGETDFAVAEDGRPQRILRFQHVTELPLHVALLVDTSASMAEMLPEVETAAIEFFRSTLEPGDRAAVFTFSEEPRLAAPFSDDLTELTAALVGLRAERGTALWDSLVHALHYFQGAPGRRALLVFSDGADHGSRFRFGEALAFAQHAGVAIYAVSFGTAASGVLEGRRRLARLAEATGGQAFTLTSVDQLAATYETVEDDLRSQYLLVYQSDGEGPELRAVEVTVRRPGATPRAMRGYIP